MMNTQREQYTIQDAAALTGLTEHTLRYYERIGLVHRIGRAQNTHRRYSEDDIGWIQFLNKLRASGMSIQQMQAYAVLQREGDSTLPERVEMLKAHRAQVEAHLRELNEHLKIIHHKIEYYQEVVAEMQTISEIQPA
jgi:DNA-binding transcriptional MerR regulator